MAKQGEPIDRVREHSHVGHRRRWKVPTAMHYCLSISHFVKN